MGVYFLAIQSVTWQTVQVCLFSSYVYCYLDRMCKCVCFLAMYLGRLCKCIYFLAYAERYLGRL